MTPESLYAQFTAGLLTLREYLERLNAFLADRVERSANSF